MWIQYLPFKSSVNTDRWVVDRAVHSVFTRQLHVPSMECGLYTGTWPYTWTATHHLIPRWCNITVTHMYMICSCTCSYNMSELWITLTWLTTLTWPLPDNRRWEYLSCYFVLPSFTELLLTCRCTCMCYYFNPHSLVSGSRRGWVVPLSLSIPYPCLADGLW